MAIGRILNRVHYPAFIASLAFLSFIAGSLIVLNRSFPYSYLNDAYRAGAALLDQQTGYNTPYATNLWARERTQETGVTIYDPEDAYNGLTLYTSSHDQRAFLISMDGEVVHEWHLPFSAVWDASAAVQEPRPDPFVFIERAHLYPNGDLLAVYIALGDTPWGYGLVKINKDSEVIWKYLERVHHDFDIAGDGRLYTLTHEIRSNEIEEAAHLAPPRVDDFLVILSPDGEEQRKVSILDAFRKSRYMRLLNTVAWYSQNSIGDFLHTNSVEIVDRATAELLPFAEEGQVLLSFREIHTIGVLDVDREEIVWALRGPWIAQHDPDILANGNILLFDNHGAYGEGGHSRVVEFDPSTLKIVWSYAGSEDAPFASSIRSGQERLPNGNTLITESDGGRIFEVTSDGRIVWEFVNPVRGGDAETFIPVVSVGQRIGPGFLDPDFIGQ